MENRLAENLKGIERENSDLSEKEGDEGSLMKSKSCGVRMDCMPVAVHADHSLAVLSQAC